MMSMRTQAGSTFSWTLWPPCASPRAGICRGAPPPPRRRPRPPHPKPRSFPAFFANLVGGWACVARDARGEVAAQLQGARRAGARDGRDPRQPRADADAPGGPKENAARLGARGGEQGITRAAPPQSREVRFPHLAASRSLAAREIDCSAEIDLQSSPREAPSRPPSSLRPGSRRGGARTPW